MGLFFKDDEKKVEVPKKETSKPVVPSTPPSKVGSLSGNVPSTLHVQPSVSSTEKAEFMAALIELYKKGNFTGPDYQEFTDALAELANQPMDESSKFKTLFMGFKVQGVTKARLIETGRKYIELINNSKLDFQKDLEAVLAKDVQVKQTQYENLIKENESIEKKMIELTERKNKNAELAAKLSDEVNDDMNHLNSKKIAFEGAVAEFVTNVQSNLDKIERYIQ